MPSAIPDQCSCKKSRKISYHNHQRIDQLFNRKLSSYQLLSKILAKKTSVKDYSYKFLSVHKGNQKTRYLAVQDMDGMKLNL
jgi:hypothetical protein